MCEEKANQISLQKVHILYTPSLLTPENLSRKPSSHGTAKLAYKFLTF